MDVPEDDEEEKFNMKDGERMKDRHGTVAGPPLEDQFGEDDPGPDFSEEGMK